jgi:hypothetical protein
MYTKTREDQVMALGKGERARYMRELRGRRRGSKARRREAKAWIGHSFSFDGATCKKWVFKKG